MGPIATTATAIAAGGAACVAYGSLIERRWYRRRTVRLPGVLERQTDRPLRLLHLSDIHLIPPQQHRVDFIRSLRDTDPDLVVVTGDLLGAQGAEDAAAALVTELTGPQVPGLVVLGSNDLFGPVPKSPLAYFTEPERRVHGPRLDTKRLVSGLESGGCTVLRNATARVQTRLGEVAAGGIDDPHLRDTVVPPADVIRPEHQGEVMRLGLVHAPYTAALDTLIAAGHRLLLAGHTHGGQVRFPPIGAVIANCDLPLDQVRGPSRYGDAWLHVSPGLGHSRYAPFRFACRPEATLLELTA